MSFFSRRGGQAGRLGLFVSVMSLVAVGCFNEPKIDAGAIQKCKTNDNCPSGYVCAPAGTCCSSGNGQSCDVGDASSPSSQVDGMTADLTGEVPGRTDVSSS